MEGDEGWPLLPVIGSEHSGSTVMLCRKSKTQICLVMLFETVFREKVASIKTANQ